MREHDDGGPAFPDFVTENETIWGTQYHGMSLRDWFAGQALAGINLSLHDVDVAWMKQHGAKRVYDIADAMLAARTTPKTEAE